MISGMANIVGNLVHAENCRIDPYVTITGTVTLGANVHIGVGACIFGTAGVEIGDNCSISPGAKIFTTSYDADTGYLANPQVAGKIYASGPVKIGNRCVVGANSVVLPGVALADDVLIGALSLVKTNLSAGVYGGVPASYLKAVSQGKETP